MNFDPILLIINFLVFIYSVILHEIAHGFVAEKLGDPTARRAGRLTLNPIPHIDPIMTIAVPAVLFIFSRLMGFGILFGSAKPVPVNPLYFDDPKKDTALVAAAGALTNFALAGLGALLYHSVGQTIPSIASIAGYMVYINLLLGIFNLIPIPPLDGSKVLASVLPRSSAAMLLSLEPYGFMIIMALFMLGTGFGSLIFRLIALGMNILGIPLQYAL